MSNQHVTMEEWQLFYMNKSAQNNADLHRRVLNHVISCPDCRAFYDKANELSRAAHSYVEAFFAEEEDDGFEAVADFSPLAAKSPAENSFTVAIDANDGNAIFLDDTIEAAGSARRYAANVEQDGACLQEDGDAFTLTLDGSTLRIHVENALQGKVSATLRSFEQQQTLSFAGCEASASMPDDDIYILELTFA